jgi:phosphoglycolate phosphatase-like HAD superfamily hydrolase
VGDSLIDLRTARAAGAPLCLARYGFGVNGFPLSALGRDDYAIDRPLELLSIL